MKETTFVGATGNRLAASVWGDRQGRATALFLHGGGQTRHAWDAAAGRLAQHVRCVSYDARGHGRSEWPANGDYRFSAMAADLRAVIEALRSSYGGPVIVVGASMGGLAAMLCGRHRPDMFDGLLLVDITPRMEQAGVDRILRFMGERSADGFASIEEAAGAIAAYMPGRTPPRSLSGLGKNLRQRSNGRWYWHWDPRFVNGPLAIEGSAEDHVDSLEQGLAALRCPITLVRGARSDLVSINAVEHFRTRFPHASYVDVAGAGHMVVGDRNDAFAEAAEKFLSHYANR